MARSEGLTATGGDEGPLVKDIAAEITERLLPRVRRPSQYIGLETNARCGNVRSAEVTVALAYADAYAVGISHLGSQVLYHSLNDLPGVACDRTYCPMPDTEQVMRAEGVELFGWESRCRLRDFDVLGFSLGYELGATNVLTMLDLAGIPLKSVERGEGHPLVVGGDAMADAPEPVADFFDLLLPGDGEEPLAALVDLVRRMKRSGSSRDEVLLAAAQTVPSAYVPRFYEPGCDDGAPAAPVALRDDVPKAIPRACLASLSDSPAITRPLVPLATSVHDRVVIEVMRGCPNACRFCQAGAVRLPVRTRSIDDIVGIARAAIDATGYREISLLSLSASDYPCLAELLDRLNAEFAPRHVSISLPSLRADGQVRHLPALTATVRRTGLTIAAEAGSQRLRRAIGKDIEEQDMIAAVRAAYEAGWRSVKVYFMAGLPGETDEDIDAIFDLCRRLSEARKDVDGRRGAITASVSWFVPKPHTPMQWCAMREADYLFAVRRRLKEMARGSPVRFRFHWIERSLLEGLLCRGGRPLGAVIEAAWRNGARMDAWSEHFRYDAWLAAFDETGIDPAAYVHREIPLHRPLPWSHIRCYRDENFLRAEYRRMRDALALP
jgi:radical SAM family uncharacterized protein